MRNIILAVFAFTIVSCASKRIYDSEGVYKSVPMESEEYCDLNLVLTGNTYEFTGASSEKGTFKIRRYGKQDIIYFHGLEYSQTSDFQFEDMEVSAVFTPDTIVIENRGIGPGDFVKFGNCKEKYIYLVRQR
jgi:hypothetical protein